MISDQNVYEPSEKSMFFMMKLTNADGVQKDIDHATHIIGEFVNDWNSSATSERTNFVCTYNRATLKTTSGEVRVFADRAQRQIVVWMIDDIDNMKVYKTKRLKYKNGRVLDYCNEKEPNYPRFGTLVDKVNVAVTDWLIANM